MAQKRKNTAQEKEKEPIMDKPQEFVSAEQFREFKGRVEELIKGALQVFFRLIPMIREPGDLPNTPF